MSLAVLIGVGLVGGLGAVARFVVDGAVAGALGRDFPYGTLAVNLLGALVLGVLAGVALELDAYRVAATGLVASFTTFSTWALESHRLGEDGQLRLGIANFTISLVLGVALAWTGRHIGAAL